MFRFADGSAKWPNTMSKEIREFVPHRQLQVVQTALDRIELRVVPVAADQDIDLPGLTGYFRLRLHETLNVDVRYMDAIPRAPSGKFFDYYSDIAGA
jgi:hypothetical protein